MRKLIKIILSPLTLILSLIRYLLGLCGLPAKTVFVIFKKKRHKKKRNKKKRAKNLTCGQYKDQRKTKQPQE